MSASSTWRRPGLRVSLNSTFHCARVTPSPTAQAVERLAQRVRGLADFEGKCFHWQRI